MMIDVRLHIDRVWTAANTLKILLPITEFLDTELALAIKLISKNKGNNINSNYRLNGFTFVKYTNSANY